MEEGAGIVTSRGDVHYVVTEHGVADLWGKNIRERAMALIEIAHPDHRAELLAAAKARHYVFPDQVAPSPRCPWEQPGAVHLASGETVLVRAVRVSDEPAVQGLFYHLSDESTYRRFLSHKRTHAHEEMQRLCSVDYASSMALVACAGDALEDIVALARYDVDPATNLAEIGIAVLDAWQRKGVGTLLFKRMQEIARARGLSGMSADLLVDNKPMLSIFQKSGMDVTLEAGAGTYAITARFDRGTSPPTHPDGA